MYKEKLRDTIEAGYASEKTKYHAKKLRRRQISEINRIRWGDVSCLLNILVAYCNYIGNTNNNNKYICISENLECETGLE